MFTLKKIWDALNYAGKPWQISLAISLAMIVGLTPFVSLHNLIIIVLALLLNIHIGSFILFSGIFSGVAYMFDPFFHSFGLSLLTNESLNSLWTSFYNNPILNISQFNNTIMMGSLTVSIIVFIPLFIIINTLLIKYRSSVASKLQNIPLFNKITFNKEDQSKVKTFRVWGAIVVIVLIVPIAFALKFYLDDFVKEQLEQNISKQSDKTVTIDKLNIAILSSNIQIDGLLVSDKKDPLNNTAIDSLSVDIDILNLIMKKFIVENLTITNINFPNHVSKKDIKKDQAVSKSSSKEDSRFDLSSLSKIDTSSIENIQQSKVQEYYNMFKEYYNKLKPILNQKEQKDEQIVYIRGKGAYINFDDNTNLPKVLVKKGLFSINYQNTIYKGEFKDFTTDQVKYKKPLLISIQSSNEKVKNISFNGSILQIPQNENTDLFLTVEGFKADDYKSNDFSLLNTIANAKLNINISKNDMIKSDGKIDILKTDIVLKESNKYIKMLNETLKSTKGINLTLNINGKLEKPHTKVKSNLEKILKQKINQVIKDQKENLKKELKNKAKEKLEKKLEDKLGDKLGEKLGDKLPIKNIFKF